MTGDLAWLGTALLMGLLGSTHCVGMCGGLGSAFTYALPEASRQGLRLLGWQLLYNGGRLLTYLLLGLLAGLVLGGLQDADGAQQVIRLVAGLFMILLGAYLAGWLQALAVLERIGGPLWRALAPLRQRLLPVRRPWQALAAGMVWGFLPCGLVYSAMALAVTRAAPAESALVMLAFGLGTLPALLATGAAAGQFRHLLQRPGTRQTAGVLVILFGLWTMLGTQMHAGHGHGAAADQHASGHHAPVHAHAHAHAPAHTPGQAPDHAGDADSHAGAQDGHAHHSQH